VAVHPAATHIEACCTKLPARLLHLLLAAAAGYVLLYGSDLALTSRMGTSPPPSISALAAVPSASAWAYVPIPSPGADLGTPVSPGAPRSDGQATAAELATNALYQRVMSIRRGLDVACDGIVHNGVAAAPIRALLPIVGGELLWSGSGPATIINEEGQVRLTPGHPGARRNFTSVPLPAAPFVSHGELQLPLLSVCALYDVTLSWEHDAALAQLSGAAGELRVLMPDRAFHIEIDRSESWVRVSYAGTVAKHYAACTGEGQNTPVGEFHVQNRSVWPGWRAYWGEYIPGGSSRNPLGARFIGTSARGRVTGWTIGIHGTNDPSSIGRRISGGCVRLHNRDIIEVYQVIPIGTRVSIHE